MTVSLSEMRLAEFDRPLTADEIEIIRNLNASKVDRPWGTLGRDYIHLLLLNLDAATKQRDALHAAVLWLRDGGSPPDMDAVRAALGNDPT